MLFSLEGPYPLICCIFYRCVVFYFLLLDANKMSLFINICLQIVKKTFSTAIVDQDFKIYT